MRNCFVLIAALAVCLLIAGLSTTRLSAADAEELVLLTNGNVLSGSTQSQGNVVILKRGDGSELRIPRAQVASSASTIQDLYDFRLSQRSFRSTAIHAEDARWCLRYGLIDQAEIELQNLQALDPSNPEGMRLQRQISAARSPHATVPQVYAPPTEAKADSAQERELLPTSLTPAAIAEFATRVQPMLINRCGNAGCHRNGGDTAWQLTHLGINVRVSARMTQRNLASAITYIDLNDPLSSTLLVYLTTSHADDRYVPSGRATQSAELTLREWLAQLDRRQSDVNPTLPAVRRAGFNQTSGPVSRQVDGRHLLDDSAPTGFSVEQNGELSYDPDGDANTRGAVVPGVEGEESIAAWPPPVIRQPAATRDLPSRPTRLPAVANPFSADLFNRRHQALRP